MERVSNRYRRWTHGDDESIKMVYPDGDLSRLSVALNRSLLAVRNRAASLGVKRSDAVLSDIGKRQGRGGDNIRFRGHGRVSAQMVSALRGRRKKVCTVTAAYLDSLAVDICPFSGRQLCYRTHNAEIGATASIDRIDSSKGYVEGNVRWVHRDVNRMRWAMTDEEFLGWIHDIVTHYGTPTRLVPYEGSVVLVTAQGRGRASPHFRGFGRVTGSYVAALRASAMDRDIPHPLLVDTTEAARYLDSLVPEVCPFSGRSLIFHSRSGGQAFTASVDRIDNARGYEHDNVRWVHRVVNSMRCDMTDVAFMELVRDIARHRGFI